MISSAPKPAPQPESTPVNDDWWQETVVCIGAGPSLTVDDVDQVRDKARVIVINSSYMLAPWADLLYACDGKWWDWHDGGQLFMGEKWTQDAGAAARYRLNYIKGIAGTGLCTDPRMIHTGSNSGFQAINMAYHKGAHRVILLGFDMQFGHEGQAHWHGEHPDNVRSNYEMFKAGFKQIAEQGKIEVINASRETALRCFPRKPLEDIVWT